MQQRHFDNSQGIFYMWWDWVLSTALLQSVVVLSLWVKPIYLPLVAIGLDLILFLRIRFNRKARIPGCNLTPFICSRALMWTAIIMVIINLIYTKGVIGKLFSVETINHEIPFITQLILAPMTFVVSLWCYSRNKKLSFCRVCQIRFGSPAERGFLGRLFTQEGRYQNQLLLILSLLSTIVAWGYYFASYANDELNRADRFFFVWATVILYVCTIIFTAFRYLGLWYYYCRKEENVNMQSVKMTKLRYIIISRNRICLRCGANKTFSMAEATEKYDTPAQLLMSFRANIDLATAIEHFRQITQVFGADIRYAYSTLSTNADFNIFHYIVFLDDEQFNAFEKANPGCEWFSINEIAKLINEHETEPLFSAEITRIYKMTMTWKTYDSEGRRKFRIRHYKPTFRLIDLNNPNIDFSDPLWLYIADNNEDKSFYRLRRFWRRYINAAN